MEWGKFCNIADDFTHGKNFQCGSFVKIEKNVIVGDDVSIGDYVLTGGELAALVVVDAVVRLLPGVLGCAQSAETESFSARRLDYPQYTQPAEYEGLAVPEILRSGDHAKIAAWRDEQALARTRRLRPDLLSDKAEPA